jgi:hypothetical protein
MTNVRIVLRQSCGVFCKNLRIGDCVISRRICGFSFLRSVKKVFLPTSAPVKDHGGIGPYIFLIFIHYLPMNILDVI